MTPTPTRPRAAPRPGIHVFRPPRRHPALTYLGQRLLLALYVVALAILAGVGVGLVRAQSSDEDVPRFVPASRGVLRSWHADLVAEHFPPEQIARALAVMACESRGDPGATGRAGEKGLMQVHPIWQELAERLYWPGISLYEPEVNVRVAAAIWRAMGWGAWSCAR